jgi:hypothetical protein
MVLDVNAASRACGAPALDPTQKKEEEGSHNRGAQANSAVPRPVDPPEQPRQHGPRAIPIASPRGTPAESAVVANPICMHHPAGNVSRRTPVPTMMKAFMTGGSGFIGTNVVAAAASAG